VAAETVRDWLAFLHQRYPPAEAASWDHVGLQVGDPDWPVARVLVALDVTRDVVAEAVDGPPTLLLAHHPLLFRPLTALTPATPAGGLALTAARHGSPSRRPTPTSTSPATVRAPTTRSCGPSSWPTSHR
jgi:putative NIF3 family GTP cyclohydrolase 1 type 2